MFGAWGKYSIGVSIALTLVNSMVHYGTYEENLGRAHSYWFIVHS
jgi:hypothetical protein